MRTGDNIRRRSDGRYEARYCKYRDENGKIIYGYCYGKTYEEAFLKRDDRIAQLRKAPEMNLLIIGAGDLGQDVFELVKQLRVFQKVKFLDDNVNSNGVIGKCQAFEKYTDEFPIAIAAVGDNTLREKWTNQLVATGYIIPSFIHPSANVSLTANIKSGTIICAGSAVGYGAIIGKGCIIDSGAIIERNVTIGDWTLIECGQVVTSKK